MPAVWQSNRMRLGTRHPLFAVSILDAHTRLTIGGCRLHSDDSAMTGSCVAKNSPPRIIPVKKLNLFHRFLSKNFSIIFF
jgi:hypothetical protein